MFHSKMGMGAATVIAAAGLAVSAQAATVYDESIDGDAKPAGRQGMTTTIETKMKDQKDDEMILIAVIRHSPADVSVRTTTMSIY